MKPVLEYQRKHKPRGGWRYPLWFRFGVDFDAEQEQELGFYCNWAFSKLFLPLWGDFAWYSSRPRVVDCYLPSGVGFSVHPVNSRGERVYNIKDATAYAVDFSLYYRNYSDGSGQVGRTVVETTFYCLHKEARERLVNHLRDSVYPELLGFVSTWELEHVEEPGEDVVTLGQEIVKSHRLVVTLSDNNNK